MNPREVPIQVEIVAGIDALAGIFSLRWAAMMRNAEARSAGLTVFDGLVRLLTLVTAAALLGAAVNLLRVRRRPASRRGASLRAAVVAQRWAGLAFVSQALALIGLSLAIPNESLTGSLALVDGLLRLLPAALCLSASKSLTRIGTEYEIR